MQRIMQKTSSLFSKTLQIRSLQTTPESKLFFGYKEKAHFSVYPNQRIKMEFSYGRGVFSLKIAEGRISTGAGEVDITDLLPKEITKSGKFKLSINNGVKINGFDITEIVKNASIPSLNKYKK